MDIEVAPHFYNGRSMDAGGRRYENELAGLDEEVQGLLNGFGVVVLLKIDGDGHELLMWLCEGCLCALHERSCLLEM
jgi:hypothetical protein